MVAKLIDGTAAAARLRQNIATRVAEMNVRLGRVPGLAVVLVGDDPASQVYVRNKGKATIEVGMRSIEHKLAADTAESTVLDLVAKLNADPAVDGILVQLPLPKHISAERVVQSIDPDKDVDGLTTINAGRLMTSQRGLVPCTPSGCMLLLKDEMPSLSGLHAVVIGRSNLVGKPIAQLLLQADCTVTMAHSRTNDLPAVCRSADILIAAVGKPNLVRGDWIKPGAVVIDVGINRITDADGKSKLCGDVATHEAMNIARAITPVPRGVGPMTIACLLQNTLTAFERRNG
ncbi:MAG TPA: bifunctional methylenetetrahydrofolate dehydrogenase/methenyltetrahydrofolate cyclohydrolase FolD [Steroidobacteraceae bacterium]|nr:bifunctional methylenetetrahydrofolate dehydrogenase/methenyltetrahydrofolate cyclohydrolase FolD [Steroidobacteraceae bacterium]